MQIFLLGYINHSNLLLTYYLEFIVDVSVVQLFIENQKQLIWKRTNIPTSFQPYLQIK